MNTQTSFLPDEVEKLLNYYGVEDLRRTRLLTDADALAPEYMQLIGLEASTSSVVHWELEVVPGLLQTANPFFYGGLARGN